VECTAESFFPAMSLIEEQTAFRFQFEGKREVVDEVRARQLLAPLFDTFVTMDDLAYTPDEAGTEVPLPRQHVMILEEEEKAHKAAVAVVVNDRLEHQEGEPVPINNEEQSILEAEVDAHIAAAAADEQVEPVQVVESIKFSGKSLTVAAAHVVAQLLKALPLGLKIADISDILASQPTEDARQTLAILADALVAHADQLVTLDVSDNALGPDGVVALQPLLERVKYTIHDLLFNNDGMAAAACKKLADILVGEESESKSETLELRRFHAFNNLSENAGAKELARILAASPYLEDVRVSTTRIQAMGGVYLAESLVNLKNLKSIDFSDNAFDARFGLILAQSLKKQINLKVLNLTSTGLDVDATRAICDSLIESGCTLEVLNLSSNDLPSEAAEDIARLISAKPSLRIINVEENELGNEGIIEIANAIGAKGEGNALIHDHVESVSFAQNEITGSSVDAICEMIVRLSPRLQKLELNSNMFSHAALTKLQNKVEEIGNANLLGSFDENQSDVEEDDDADEE
jgi:Ran GTPase-activating protein (RanGAP) involved in mRNA processing and transport